MALISTTKVFKREKIKTELNAETLAQINAYCEWASIDDVGFFIEEAAHFIFAKDKDFKAYQKTLKRQAQGLFMTRNKPIIVQLFFSQQAAKNSVNLVGDFCLFQMVNK